ncbi:hypothetical protein [Eubacterium callanderi]|uniref:hypothetical protein n=1 Tax=Eubacterium callanderi TaxID=53442 RepID=UPI001AA19EE4|nr:hypothetical protein [Eubacterium callanderi]
MGKDNTGTHLLCFELQQENPETAEAIAEQWAEEHPPKTYMGVFLEKFPNARLEDDGSGLNPTACIADVYGENEKPEMCRYSGYYCYDCWNREVEE